MDKLQALKDEAKRALVQLFLPISTGFLNKIILPYGDLPPGIIVREDFEIEENNVDETLSIFAPSPSGLGKMFIAGCSINYDRSNGELMEQETCESLKTTYPQIYQLFTNKERLAQLYDTAKIDNIIQSKVAFERRIATGNVDYTDGTSLGYYKTPSGEWIKNIYVEENIPNPTLAELEQIVQIRKQAQGGEN